jgi:hypothetical protein
MPSIIRIKRSPNAGNPPTLGAGELAYSAMVGTQSNGGDRLYVGFGTETSGDAANHYVIGGKYFTDMMDHVAGTLTASSALIVDSSSKLDNLKVDNLDLNGNTISSTDTNGNIVLDPNGTGYVQVVGTNALIIPVGTTNQQGPTVQGGIRYNTDNSAFEGYNGSAWTSLGGVRSVDGLTYIRAESSSGASNDELEFFAAAADNTTSTKYLGLNRTRLAVLPTTTSTSTTTGALTVAGGTGIAENLWVGGTTNLASALTYGGVTLSNSVTGTGSMVLSASPTFTGTIVAPNANSVSMGTPTSGTLSGAVSMTTSTSVTNGIAQLNQVLSKLVPAQPPNFPSASSLSLTTANFSMAIAVASGSQVTNGNAGVAVAAGTTITTTRVSTFSTNSIANTGPGDSGTITVNRNTSPVVSRTLTIGNSTATLVSTTITNTSNGTATVTVGSITGVIQAGHLMVTGASGAFGGLVNSTTYYVTAVLGNQVTLATYNTSTGVVGAAFSATSTASGTLTLTATTDVSTTTANNTSLALTNNLAFPTASPGFWETIDVAASGTAVSPGWNVVNINHGGSGGTTNNLTWYYDSSAFAAPSVTATSITPPGSPTLNYSSGIPHYAASNVFTLAFTANRLSYDCYLASGSFVTGSSGGAFQTPASLTYATAGIATPLAANLYVASGSASLTTTASTLASGFSSSATGPSITVSNGYTTGAVSFSTALASTVLYKTTTTGSTTVLDEGSIFFNGAVGGATTPVAYRVPNPGSSDTPVFTAGQAAFNSQSGTVQTYDAKVVAGSLKHDVTNYSTGYLPAGPNYSTHGASQYFTFVFVRTGVTNFRITYNTTTGIAGMWWAMPGTGGISGTTSSNNKWLDLTKAWDLDPTGGAQGTGLTLSNTGTNTVIASQGSINSTDATNNEIWVRIKLTANQSISALYLG